MNFNLFDQLPKQKMQTFLEHILRSTVEAERTPFSIDPNKPSRIVDKNGVIFADCKNKQYADDLFKFLGDLDAWLV